MLTCKFRLKMAKMCQIERGSTVRISGARPQYLNGHTATVESVNGETVSVTFDSPVPRGPTGKSWHSCRVPYSMLEVVIGKGQAETSRGNRVPAGSR